MCIYLYPYFVYSAFYKYIRFIKKFINSYVNFCVECFYMETSSAQKATGISSYSCWAINKSIYIYILNIFFCGTCQHFN